LRTVKNAGYAWRQAIVYLSLAPEGAAERFLVEARELLARQSTAFREQFSPILMGLEQAWRGESPAVRLLGWSTGAHPLMGD
jgi:hypothetical protein